jgi:hypothetical protein
MERVIKAEEIELAAASTPPAAPARGHRQSKPAPAGRLAAARAAVRDFLADELQARAARITKLAPALDGPVAWHAEAEVLLPDLDIKTLGLPLSQEVLERQNCAVELDTELAVISYEFTDPDKR